MADDDSPQVAAFLGNTGERYSATRHNVGWMVLDRPPFAGAEGWQRKFTALWTRVPIAGASVPARGRARALAQLTLLKPQTMMNLSGESVQAAMRFFRFAARDLLVVHDDVELEFGRVAVRFGGGLAGHNGLRSVAHCLSTRDFWRVRIGGGRPGRGDLHNYVLGRFTPEEEAALPAILDAAANLIVESVREGAAAVAARGPTATPSDRTP